MEEGGNTCPMVTLTNCCKQVLHLDCYLKSLPKCPFCREDQTIHVPERIVIVQNDYTSWVRMVRAVSIFTILCACISVTSLMSTTKTCDAPH